MSRIDPRVVRTRQLVLDAAVVELGGRGWGAFSLEAVAERAGVARSTLYRHWPDRHALVVDALEHHTTQPAPELAGSPRERVEQLVAHLAEAMADPLRSAVAVALLEAGERDPVLAEIGRRFSARRRAALERALAAAGVDEPALVAAALAGAVFYRRMTGEEPLAPAQAPALVAAVLGPA